MLLVGAGDRARDRLRSIHIRVLRLRPSMQNSFFQKVRTFARPLIDELKYNANIAGASLRYDGVVLSVCALLFFVLDYWLIETVVSTCSGSFGSYLLQCHAIDLVGGCAFMAYTNLLLDLVKPYMRFKRLIPTIVFMLICGIFWEGVAPMFVPGSTGDALDLLVYLLGACCYLLLAKTCTRKAREDVADGIRRGLS